MEFRDVLLKRRSTRAFTDKPVTKEQINALLEAAVRAPSACNLQSWHFYVVTDPAVKAKFTGVCSAWATSAPVIFVVCTDGEAIISRFGDRGEKLFVYQDTAAATENLLLCAADMGLGGCWMGAFNEAECRRILSVPDKYNIVAVIPVGEPVSEVPPRDRKPLGEVVTYVGDLSFSANEKKEEKTENEGEKKEKPFILKGASLPGAVFDDLNLENATFNNINMRRARFSDINMSSAFFGGLTLNGAYFGCVDLSGATFENPSFDGAVIKNCSLKDVSVEGCALEDMKIDGVSIEEALKFYKENH